MFALGLLFRNVWVILLTLEQCFSDYTIAIKPSLQTKADDLSIPYEETHKQRNVLLFQIDISLSSFQRPVFITVTKPN